MTGTRIAPGSIAAEVAQTQHGGDHIRQDRIMSGAHDRDQRRLQQQRVAQRDRPGNGAAKHTEQGEPAVHGVIIVIRRGIANRGDSGPRGPAVLTWIMYAGLHSP